MTFRRKHRWLRRLALGFALATAVAAGNASFAFAKVDEGGSGTRYVSTPGWSGSVDDESGVPMSAGIPHGDEEFLGGATEWQVVPYLSHGVLTEPTGVMPEWQMIPYEAYNRNAAARAGLLDGGESLAAKDRIEAAPVRPEPEVSYLSHRQLEELASRPSARPDDVANRFAHSDVAPQPQLAARDEWTFERGDALALVIGGSVLAIGLGLALGFLSRPRIVGP